MMMAQPYSAPGMGGPGHPVMPHGHPMGHPGAGHMGGQPGLPMQGMHPGVAGPQVSQGPMVTGMPPGAGTQAPMQHNGMAMAHLGPQQQMFQPGGQPGQMNLGQMQQMGQQAAMMRQRMMMQQQGHPMGMNNPLFQQQMAQMKMAMPMQPQQQQQQHIQNMHNMQQQQQFLQQQSQAAQQQQHQQRMAQHAAQQAAVMRQAQNQQQAAQQMQMSRSQEQTSQPPQAIPTPAPSNQPPQPQPQPQPNLPVQQPPTQQPPKPQPTPQPVQQQGTPAASVKADVEPEEPQIKQQDAAGQVMMQDIPKQQQSDFTGQCILQLLLYQDKLANPERPTDLSYWEEIIQKYFSPTGSIRQQLVNHKTGHDKSYQLNYPSLARFFYTHFTTGIRQILMQAFDHNQNRVPNGGIHIWSNRATLTYVFDNDLRVTTQGALRVHFDDMQRIEHLIIATTGWTEYLPRHLLTPISPSQNTSPKMTNKTAKKPQKAPMPGLTAPPTYVNDFGIPAAVLQFLEIAEVMTAMGPLMEYFHSNPGISPRDALSRMSVEGNTQMNMIRMQNANMMAANGQMAFPQQRMGMNMPNQLQSPALQHLALPHGQGSPGMASNHTGSPAQSQGGIPMMHQMSAQGSSMSGPSTNTSPNVSNKRRRPSGVKMEDENSQQDSSGADKVKPSPRIGGKRQKGQG